MSRSRTCRCCSRSTRSEEHTSELQSLTNLVCRLLLEKKKNTARPAQRPPLPAVPLVPALAALYLHRPLGDRPRSQPLRASPAERGSLLARVSLVALVG